MRLLVLCHEYPPVGGGAASVCHTLAEHYAAAGHEVVAVTMQWGDLAAAATSPAGVAIHRLECLRRRREQAGGSTALLWAARALQWSRREHLRRPFDAAHAHFVMPAGIVALRLRRLGVPYVLTAHGTDVPGFDPGRFRLAHRLVRTWWRSICHAASSVVAPSLALQDLLRAAAPALVTERIPNPIEVEGFATAPKEDSILLCGRLVERKGFAWFLEALRDTELPGWSVDVVGDGPERARLEALAGELRVPVRFHGWLDHGEPRLREMFTRAAIFVFPSLRENLPMALLEAMASGCAIVATDLPGNVEAVGEHARLIRPGDDDEMRRAVVELARERAEVRRLGDASRRRATEEFGVAAVATRYLERLETAGDRV